MNILVDIGHPAHVHLFRNPALRWAERGHRVLLAIRDRDIVAELCRAYGLLYEVASRPRPSFIGRAVELLVHDARLLRMARRFDADLLLGTSVSAAHVSRLTRARSIVFEEDDADVIRLFAWLAYPFAHTIVIPDCLRDRRTRKHVVYPGYHELAYLHPNHFTPDASVLTELGVDEAEPFFILRHVALQAFHDVGQAGLSRSAIEELIDLLRPRGRVFLSAEAGLPDPWRDLRIPIPAQRMHDAMAFAAMVVSDSQTMTAEAAVLGTPAVRCNTFVGRISYLEELEHRYGLTFGLLPGNEGAVTAKIRELLAMPDLRQEWQRRRAKMLEEKIDVAEWITELAERVAGQGSGT